MNKFGNSIYKIITLNMSKLNVFKRTYPIHEVLFYGGEDEDETRRVGLDNLRCIYYLIVHASSTVDVCVPTLASETIIKCLVTLQQKGLKIRVAVHKCKKLQMISGHGIDLKVISTNDRFGHDFILIDADDNDAVAILGSLDYETSRVNQNRDATVLTSEGKVIYTLKQEFERVWNSVDNTTCKKDTCDSKEREL